MYAIVFDSDFDGEASEHREHKSRGDSTTARVVCAKCNGGWMSQLETQAKQLLVNMIRSTDVPVVLTPEQQVVVSTWMTKTTMVADYVVRRPPVFSEAQRRLMTSQMVPPYQMQVRLAAQDPDMAVAKPLRWLRVLRACSDNLSM
jgi:hypothetical protein